MWALLIVSIQLSYSFGAALEGKDISVIGIVDSLPVEEGRRLKFNFRVDAASYQNESVVLPEKIKLSWYQDYPSLKLGDTWQLTVRLKKPHGYKNPAGFDYEQWLFSQKIGAQGYVRPHNKNRMLVDGANTLSLTRMRQSIADGISARAPQLRHEAIISALSIGDRQAMTDEQWRVLLVTGTNHLMAISGLHIGLIAGLFFVLGRWLWCRSVYLVNLVPAQKAAAVFAIVGAVYYSFLAGFSIPTQRAMIMVVVVMLGYIFLKQRSPSVIMSIALLLVLLWDPLAVLSASFWLSFAAVAILIYGLTGRLAVTGFWWKWGRAQWLLSIGLVPLLLFGFQQASLVSPLANIIAVPWVGFIVVPLSLLASSLSLIHTGVADGLFQLTDYAFEIIWVFLTMLAELPWAQWQQPQHPLWISLAAVVGVVLVLAPRGLPIRVFGLIWLLPLLLFQAEKPKQGELWFTLLDVGQGLSAVVRTANHTLIYDAGPKFSDDFDAGRAVIVPYLTGYLGVSQVDKLVIGHGDNDHIGGAVSILSAVDVKDVITSVPKELQAFNSRMCVAGERWQWDGVEFEMLHPDGEFRGDENDLSCVLSVRSPSHSILLTGDIERRAERYLIDRYAEKLDADILVVPHHGSLTSSTHAFIDAVSPEVALFPVGYRNQFGFPKTEIVERYRMRNVRLFDTAQHGALIFEIDEKKHPINPKSFRDSSRYYWHGKE